VLALLTLAVALQDAGGAPTASPVSFDYSPPTISVHLRKAMPLETVVAALCERVEARCDRIPATFPPRMVPRKDVSGAWEFVIEALMAGSGIGYAVVPPGEGRSPQLVIQGTSSLTREGSPDASGLGEAPTPSAEAESVEEPIAPEATTPAEVEPNDAKADAKDHSPQPAIPAPVLPGSIPGGGTPRFMATPFTGPDGRPLMVAVPAPPPDTSTQTWVATPFTDEGGGPLTVPFAPDRSPVAPFSDPNGNPIPIEVGKRPPAKLEYPIPPTPSVPPSARDEKAPSPVFDSGQRDH
jgi:hypothetical protein